MLDKAVKSCDEKMERKLNPDLSVKVWLERSESGRLGTEGNPDVVLRKQAKMGIVSFLDQVQDYPQCLKRGRN